MNTSQGSGRLTLSAALSRNTSLDSSWTSNTTQTKSASVAKAEREIKALKDENKKLRKDLDDMRSLYNQIITENSHEKFDERRITVLKSQIIQLERQVLLMSEALSSRSVTLTEVENALSWLADKWRYYIGLDIKGPEVNVQRSDLTKMVETAESARIKLYKNLENTSTERLALPLLFMNEFLKPGKQEEITVFDIALGKTENLNLKHVGKLETKLASLYRELITLHDLMENGSYLTMSNHMSCMIRERTSTKLLKSCAMMKDTCADLMSLSLLYPTAPWPPLKRCCIKDITVEKVMKNMPSLPRSKSTEVQRVIEALLKAVNYRHHMVTQEVKNLKEDIKFHKSVYNLQVSYIDSLFDVVRDGYASFEESTNEIIVKPLKDILDAFEDLNNTASEGAFKEFLMKFKHNSEQLKNAVEKLDTTDCSTENGAVGALSQYGQDFFSTLDKLVAQSQRTRDKAAKNKTDLCQQQEKLEEELRNILDEQELKYQEHFETDNSQDSRYISEVKEEDETSGNVSGRKSKQNPGGESETGVCISGRKSKQKKIKEDVNDGRKSHTGNREFMNFDKDNVNIVFNEGVCMSGRKSTPGKLEDDVNFDNESGRKSHDLPNIESDDGVCLSSRKSRHKTKKDGNKTGRKSQQSGEPISPSENGLPSLESDDEKRKNVNQKKQLKTELDNVNHTEQISSRMKALNLDGCKNLLQSNYVDESDDDEICVNINQRKQTKPKPSAELESGNDDNTSKDKQTGDEVNDRLPPQSKNQSKDKVNKPKKERKYIPNTFVPNRTLQLRRSGSLSRLSDTSDQGPDDPSLIQTETRVIPPIKRSNSSFSVDDEDNQRGRKQSIERGIEIRRSESKERRTSTVNKKPPFR